MLNVSKNFGKVASIDSKSVDSKSNAHNRVINDRFNTLGFLKKEGSSPRVKVSTTKYVCYRCNKQFPTNEEVVAHLKLIHNACAAMDCSKISDFKMHSSVCINRGFGCNVCSMKFSEKYMLFMHLNEHIGAAFYVCHICRNGFQQRKDLQRHLLRIHNKNDCVPVTPSHTKAVYQKCGQCSKYYRLFAEFEEHTSVCCNSAVHVCQVCLIQFANPSALEDHKLVEHKSDLGARGYLALKNGKQYFCGLCYLGFTQCSTLKLHLQTHDSDVNHICEVCHCRFTNDDDLQAHYLLHIEEEYVLHNIISQHSCDSCKKTFQTQEELKNHLLNCSNHLANVKSNCMDKKYSLNTSDKENESETVQNGIESEVHTLDVSNVLIYALRSGDDLLNCEDNLCIVVMDFQSLFILQRGICVDVGRMPEVKNSFALENDDPIDAALIETHMIKILSSPNGEATSVLQSELCVNTENLPLLEQNLNTESQIIGRMEMNLDESNDTCEQRDLVDGKMCIEFMQENKDSAQSEKLKEVSPHKNIIQTDNVAVNCEKSAEIIQEYTVPYSDKNIDTSHENINEASKLENADGFNEMMFVCNICEQVFSTKTSLCLHIKGSHTGFDCYRCGRSFKTDEDLKDHEKVSHPSAFHCDLCEVSYSKEHLLKKHKRSAHGGNHFACNICDKSYVLKNEYDVHMMLHQGQTPPTKCEFCGKVYASLSNYMRHKALHEGKPFPKKYICTVCDKAFIARSPLQKHLTTHIRKSPLSYECPKCKMYFSSKQLSKHVESHDA